MKYRELQDREESIHYAWELELQKGTQIDYYVWRKSYLKSLRESKARLQREENHRGMMELVYES